MNALGVKMPSQSLPADMIFATFYPNPPRGCPRVCMQAAPKLIYFDARGVIEPTRLLLAAAGVQYEDKRYKVDMTAKPPVWRLPSIVALSHARARVFSCCGRMRWSAASARHPRLPSRPCSCLMTAATLLFAVCPRVQLGQGVGSPGRQHGVS